MDGEYIVFSHAFHFSLIQSLFLFYWLWNVTYQRSSSPPVSLALIICLFV